MKCKLRILISLLMFAFMLFGCKDSVERPPSDNVDVPEYGFPPSWFGTGIVDTTRIEETPFGDAEAERLALWLSGDLVAPVAPYERILRDLALIREAYSDLDPPLRGVFWRYWGPSAISVMLSSSAVDQYLAGTYTDLDELNTLFRLNLVVDRFLKPGRRGSITLEFLGRLHPARIAEFYEKVESVEFTGISRYCCDGSRIYPWYADGKLTYLFREGQGDCPAGCYMNRYWYFRTDDEGNIDYLGSYTDWEDEVEPPWWPEASRNRYEFYYGELD